MFPRGLLVRTRKLDNMYISMDFMGLPLNIEVKLFPCSDLPYMTRSKEALSEWLKFTLAIMFLKDCV